jgi:glycerol-3-phosphate acyltransferase PlsY
VISYVLAAFVGYVLGSFPTAYLLVRWKSNIDIRKAGSGNVGTLNSYEVTNSKAVGAGVLLADFLKGMLAVLAVHSLIGSDFATLASGGVGAVAGHNFPVWLRFKGGRGLATAAGVMAMLGWMFVLIWLAAWFLAHRAAKDVNVGNAVATIAILLVGLIVPAPVLQDMIRIDAPLVEFRIFLAVLSLMIVLRLVEPVREFIDKKRSTIL